MARVTLKLDGLTEPQLREVLRACAVERDLLPAHTDWRPRVNNEGSRYFTVEVDPAPTAFAASVLGALQMAAVAATPAAPAARASLEVVS